MLLLSFDQVGDLFNFLSAIFFGIHMLRTEHISRSTKKENFLAILGYEVVNATCKSSIFSVDNLSFSYLEQFTWFIFRSVLWPSYPQSGFLLEGGLMVPKVPTN